MEHRTFRWGWAAGALLLALAIPVARRIVRPAMTPGPDPSAILEA